MQKPTLTKSLLLFAASAILVFAYYYKKPSQHTVSKVQERETAEMPDADNPNLAQQQEFDETVDRSLGYVPTERLIAAHKYAQQLEDEAKTKRTHSAIAGIVWQERGPSNVGGRTASIMIDPNDATHKAAFAGGVDGGLWKTTDITVVSPVWTAINDFFNNLAVTTIAYDPSSTTTMYFGTGEGWFNIDAVRGAGIWKSTDGGATWAQLASTAGNTDFDYVQKIVVDASGNVYAAASSSACNRGGLFKSTNGGTTWTLVLGVQGGTCAASNCSASDVEIAADGTLYASLGIFQPGYIYKSATGNAGSWTQLNIGGGSGFPAPTPTNYERISIGCAPSSAATVYVLTQSTATNGLFNIYKTTNAGALWTTCGAPSWQDQCAGGVFDFTRGQAWYDLSVAVDPANANNVFIGGVDLMKSTNGGTSWTQITDWSGGCYQYVHADQHTIVFSPGSSTVVYFGNDGGVWATTNATANPPTITNKNTGYNVTQFYSVAMHPTSGSNYFLCGAQDNGCQKFNSPGINATTMATGGDGAFCHIDQLNPTYQLTSYVYTDYFISTNGGATFNNVNLGNNGLFINPSDFDNTAKILYSSSAAGQYHRWNNPEAFPAAPVTATPAIAAFGGGQVTSVTVSPNTANRVFFGLNNGRVVRVDAANGGAPVGTSISTGLPNATVSCVAVETGNDNHLMVTYSNYGTLYVGESFNGGTSWTNDVGNLPDMPIRWVMLDPHINTKALLATEVGVWTTNALAGGATNWGPSNTGLANVRTDMLQYRASDGLIAAATHGRGMFTTDGSANGPLPLTMLTFSGVAEAGDNLLRWSTATETNNQKFEVQRSLDGENFTAIGDVNGAGTSSVQHNYTFNDNNVTANTLYYYRLRQVDFDGVYTFSKIISLIAASGSGNPVLSVYPNPFVNNVNVTFATGLSNITINLFDLSGKLIYQNSQTGVSGNELNIDLSKQNLAGGIYILNIVNGTETYNFRIAKVQ